MKEKRKPNKSEQVKMKKQTAGSKKKTSKLATIHENDEDASTEQTTTKKAAAGDKERSKVVRKKTRRTVRAISYKAYLRRLQAQSQPDCTISKRGLAVMESLIDDLFRRVADEAAVLTRHRRRSTMTVADVEAAVGLLLPVRDGEVRQNALTAGRKAVRRVKAASAKK
jgi:histone H2B